MKLGDGIEWTPVHCPHCGKAMDGQMPVDNAGVPDEGAIGVCVNCTGIGVFTKSGAELRLPTEEEQAGFDADPRLQYLRFAVVMSRAGIGPDDLRGETDE